MSSSTTPLLNTGASNTGLGIQTGFGTGSWLYRGGQRSVPVDPGYARTTGTDRLFASSLQQNLQLPTETAGSGSGFGLSDSTYGAIGAVAAIATNAVNAFYSSEIQKEEFKMAADQRRFQSSMASMNARRAEEEAQQILFEGHREVARFTLQQGQEIARRRVNIASGGLDRSVGSAAIELASAELLKNQGIQDISSAATRAANRARAQGVNFANTALLSRTAANSFDRYARNTDSLGRAGASLLSDVSQVALMYSQTG